MKKNYKIIFFVSFNIIIFAYPPILWASEILANKPIARDELANKMYSRGICSSQTEKINLDELFFISNEKIKVPQKKGYGIISIKDESIKLEIFNGSNTLSESISFNLEMEINIHNKKEDNLDLDVSFVLLNEIPAIFWRETYRHQRFRQGIFAIKEGALIWMCEGIGGVYKSH